MKGLLKGILLVLIFTSTSLGQINIQDAINAMPTGGTLFLPEGTYFLTDTVVSSASGLTIVGAGINRTVIKWDMNDNTRDIFKFVNCRYFGMTDLTIQATPELPARSAVVITHTDNNITAEGSFERVFIEGTDTGGLVNGYHITGSISCDMLNFKDCKVNHAANGINNENPQSRLWVITNTQFMYNQIGIRCQNGFVAIGTFFAENTMADIEMFDSAGDAIVIQGGRSEGSNRFLVTPSTGFPSGVIVEGFSFATNKLNADKKAIQFYNSGELSLRTSKFGLAGWQSEVILDINEGSVNIQGCAFRRDSDTLPFLQVNKNTKMSIKNIQRMNATNKFSYLPDLVH